MAKVDGNISDLFFNTDVSAARKLDKKGHFEGWEESVLLQEADDMLRCLERLGVPNLPTAIQLVEDFYKRI